MKNQILNNISKYLSFNFLHYYPPTLKSTSYVTQHLHFLYSLAHHYEIPNVDKSKSKSHNAIESSALNGNAVQAEFEIFSSVFSRSNPLVILSTKDKADLPDFSFELQFRWILSSQQYLTSGIEPHSLEYHSSALCSIQRWEEYEQKQLIKCSYLLFDKAKFHVESHITPFLEYKIEYF